jgi:hypothetical protein
MKPQLLLLIVGSFLLSPLYSQEKSKTKDYEVTAGFGMLIYQSAYNMQDSYGVEAAVRSNITGPVDWQAGLRLGLNPALPEVFGRILAFQEVGAWRPEIGLELGLSSRAYFDDGAMLLQETREAMQTDINGFYMAIHTAPVAFEIREKWKLSVLEIDFGTHFTNLGRTLRAQVTVISIGKKF